VTTTSNGETQEAFRRAAKAAVEAVLDHEPELATALGDHRHDDRVDDRSAEGRRDARRVYVAHRTAVASNDEAALDPDDRADKQILLNALDQRLFAIDEVSEIEWNPLVYNPGDALYPLIARRTIPLPDRLRAIAARLEEFPRIVELAQKQLTHPPRVHLETAIAQNAGTVSLVRDEVSRLLAAEPSMSSSVEPARARALDALGRHRANLESLLEKLDVLEEGDGSHTAPSSDGRFGFRLGADKFARKLELTLNSSITAEQVAERARAHLDELSQQMEDACRSYLQASEGGAIGHASSGPAGKELVRSVLDRIALERPDDDSVVTEARHALEESTRAVQQNGLASVPTDEMEVVVMPEFRRGIAVAYCDAPGPLESGGQTFLAVAPTPRDWSRERVDSFYREYNSALIVDLIVHEAMPGHALQLAHARRFEGSTPVRQVFTSGSFVEGWATHAERLMADAGHGGPAVRVQQLKMQLRMTINAILDAGVHADHMDAVEAIELMTVRGFQEDGEAVGKWRRACLTSAQLSTYFVGYTELADLIAKLGPITSYDSLLSHGSPPPRILGSLLSTDSLGASS
jgi:uncharacterized protein (DUF885 family)